MRAVRDGELYQRCSRGATGWSKPPSPSRVHASTLSLARAAPSPFSIKCRDVAIAISFPSCLLCPCQHVARRRQRSKVTKIKPPHPISLSKSIAHLRESNSLPTCCSVVTIFKSICFGCQCKVQISKLFDGSNLQICICAISERLKMKEHRVRCS